MAGKAEKAAEEFAADAQEKADAGELPGAPNDPEAVAEGDLSGGAPRAPQRPRDVEDAHKPYDPDGVPIA